MDSRLFLALGSFLAHLISIPVADGIIGNMTGSPQSMARRYILERVQTVRADMGEVTRFFEDPRNLQVLTPPFLNFNIETVGEVEMKEGALIDYKIRLHGVPMRWRTRIVQYNPGQDFVDVQVSGPYKYWHHLHTFRATAEGTEIGDRVAYELPLGPLGEIVHSLIVRRQLNAIFGYRKTMIAERFCPSSQF